MDTFFKSLFIILLILSGCKERKNDNSNIIPNERFEHIRKIVNDKIEKGEIPSVSIAVAEKGKIIWMESFGWADKENKVKASLNTLYSIASISKPITATGILKLYEQGKINLDENIDTYIRPVKLKYYCGDSIKVTCRHLLSHTSGLPMYFNYYYDDDTATIPEIEEVIKRYGTIIRTPSDRYAYANLGYGILGYIISRVSQKDFDQYMKEEIFTPLKMPHTTFNTTSKTKDRLAKRYDLNGKLLPFSFCDTPGAGNCSSTANDLIHFAMFYLNNKPDNKEKILSDSTIKLMQSKQCSGAFYHSDDYGLGWFINDKDYKYKIVYHAGGMDGVESMLKLVPAKDIAIVALVNQTTYNAEFTNQLTDSIMAEIIPDIYEKQNVKQDPETVEKVKAKEVRQSDLSGLWEGFIYTPDEKVPVQLIFQEDGDIHVHTRTQFNTDKLTMFPDQEIQHKMLLNLWFFYNGHFMGWYVENIPGEYLSRCSGITLLDLEYQAGKLKGTAAALASSNRMYYGISHYMELERK